MTESPTSAMNAPKFKNLMVLLRELFQLDQSSRTAVSIASCALRGGEVTQFLERNLLPQLRDTCAR